jgi:diguanylate cyclase (GGDEF)-like protein
MSCALALMTVSSIYYANQHRTHLRDIERLSQISAVLERAHGHFLQANTAMAALTFLRDEAYYGEFQRQFLASRQGLEAAQGIAAAMGMWADVAFFQQLAQRMDAYQGGVEAAVNEFLYGDLLRAIELGRQLTPEADAISRELEAASGAWLSMVAMERQAAERATLVSLLMQGSLGGFSLLVALAVATMFHVSILQPLAALRRAAQDIARGHLAARAPLRGPEEMASLAQAFNDMTEALIDRNRELEHHIAELQQAQETIWRMAYYDPLTGLPNRHLFEDRLQMAIAQARRRQRLVGVLFLDLDRFKLVNDSFGHGFGDKLLRLVGRRLGEALDASHTLARTGGDEFVVLLPELERQGEVEEAARRLLAAMQAPFHLDGRELYVTASMGVVLFPQHGEDAQLLLRHADIAMYRAKERGRNTYQVYSTVLDSGMVQRLAMESELHCALEKGELVLHYQPIVDLEAGRIVGVEALVRWQHPQRGLLYPDQFIPLAEESGLIVPLGEWVLRSACRQAVAWQNAPHPPLFMTVNLSPRQMRQDDELMALVEQVLTETGLPPEQLMLEVTEGAIMGEMERAIGLLMALRGMGVQVCVDDFGTGHSSLSHLKMLPVDVIKVDRTFVWDMVGSQADAAIVAAVVTLGRALGLRVIAEGVETQEQAALLRGLGCHEMQGYLFSRPLPAREVSRLLNQGLELARSA